MQSKKWGLLYNGATVAAGRVGCKVQAASRPRTDRVVDAAEDPNQGPL